MSQAATPEQVFAAQLREKDAEIEYLRNRNLNLSIALENVSGQLAVALNTKEEVTDDDADV